MKNYDEIAQGLFERRDEYFKERTVRNSVIKKTVMGVSGVLAVALIASGVWKSGTFTHNTQIDSAQLEAKEKKTEILVEAENSLQNGETEKNAMSAFADTAENKKGSKKSVRKTDAAGAENNSKASSETDGKKNKSDGGKGSKTVSGDVISKAESDCTYGMPCYAMPGNGTYAFSYPVQWSVNKHGSSKKYQLSILITKDGNAVSDAEKSAELKRLKDAGCDIKKYTLSYYESDGVSKGYYTQLGGVFTKEQLETLFTGRKYGYFFDFMNNGDSSSAEVADGDEFFEKTTKKGETYLSEYN